MAGYADELSLRLTAKDELSGRLKDVNRELKDVAKQMVRTREEIERTGSPEAVAELKRLDDQYERLAKSQKELARSQARNREELRKTTSQYGKTATAAQRLGSTIVKHQKDIQRAGLIGMAAFALFARSAVKAFAEAERMQLQLEIAYAKFPALADLSIDALRRYNDELMATTGADNDALAAAEGLLARFELTGTQIRELIPLVNDYAIATGKELPEAAETIGKALLGNARAMKTLGVNFTATGDRAADLATIMDALEAKVGGTGEAFGKTAAGQMAIAQQRWEEFKETIGEALIPALELLVAVLKPVAALITAMPKPMQQVAIAIGVLSMAAMIATPRIIAMRASMATLRATGANTGSTLKGVGSYLAAGWGAALAIGAIALGYFAQQMAESKARTQEFADMIDVATGKLTQAGIAAVVDELTSKIDAVDWAKFEPLGLGLEATTRAIVEGGAAWDAWMAAYNAGPPTGPRDPLSILGNNVRGLRGEIVMAGKTATITAQVAKSLGIESEVAAGGVSALGDAAGTAADEVSALEVAITGVLAVANRQQALARFRKDLKKSLTDPSKAATYQMLSTWQSAYSTFEDGSLAQARFVKNNYKAMAESIQNSNLSDKAKAQLLAPLKEARDEAILLIAELDGLNGTQVTIGMHYLYTGGTPTGPYAPKPKKPAREVVRADGGAVWGPGTGTSDSIPAMLSNGEYVVRAAAAQAIGYDQLDRLNRADTLPPLVSAPPITLPASPAGRDAPLVGTLNMQPTGQVDIELALAREARRQDRDRRTRHASAR